VKALAAIEEALHQMDLERLLGGEHDGGNAIVTLQAGAGGTEAQDWAEMLMRQIPCAGERARATDRPAVDLATR
jgi:peptide chain release factor 2